MANETIFKGLKLITGTTTMNISDLDKATLYFVRTDLTNGKADGYLVLNGKKYGTAEDLRKALQNDTGTTPYINFRQVGNALRSLDATIKAMDYAKTSGSTGSSTELTGNNVVDVRIVQVDGKITGHTVGVRTLPLSGGTFIAAGDGDYNWTVGEGVIGVGLAKSADISSRLKADEEVIAAGLNKLHRDITAETADREAAIAALDATVSDKTDDGYIKVTVEETNGKLTSATLTAKTASMSTGSTEDFNFNSLTKKWSARTTSSVDGLATVQNVEAAMIKDEEVIAQALNTLSGQIKTNEVTIVKQGTAEDGYASTYYLAKSGATETALGAKINIPKDQFLNDAEVKSGQYIHDNPSAYKDIPSDLKNNHMYLILKFALNTAAETPVRMVYVDVHDLADEIQRVADTDRIHLSLSGTTTSGVSGNTLYADIKASSITNDYIANDTIARSKVNSAFEATLVKADTAIQSVNGIGTGTTPLTAITLTTANIKTSANITGVTEINSGTTIQAALQTLSTNLKNITENAVTSITSTGNTISVTGTGNARNLEIHTEATGTSTVELGHIQIKMNNNNEFYGQMYFYGNDVE